MGFYSKVVYPRFYDCLMDKPFWAKHRHEQLADVDGGLLEIGVGTGLNLPHYPKHVQRIITADPNRGMNKRLQRRLNWLQRIVGDGCTLTLDLPKLLSTQPFSSVRINSFYMEETPKTHGCMFRGCATNERSLKWIPCLGKLRHSSICSPMC